MKRQEEVLFLGTGAADWRPDMHDQSGYRRLSSIMIGDMLLIDPGPQIFEFAMHAGNTGMYDKIDTVLLTHSHSDHFNIETLKRLAQDKQITMYCSKQVANKLRIALAENDNIVLNDIEPFMTFEVGIYTITALIANHLANDFDEQTFHYIVEVNGKTIFYGCDGAWLPQSTWYYMKNKQFNLMIMDGTLGDAYGDYRIFEHNSLRMVELMAETFRTCHVIKSDGRIFISHLSYESQECQKECEKRLEKSDIGVAYDGLCILP